MDTILVMTWDHPNLVTQNFSALITSSFRTYNQRVLQISLSKPLDEQFAQVDLSKVTLVFCIGHEPLSISINGKSIYEIVTCPFYVYVLDTPIYNMRSPLLQKFLTDSALNDRLRLIFAEQSYIDLYSSYQVNGANPRIEFMPFACFPSINNKVTKVDRAVVIGGIGTELSTFDSTLENTIEKTNPYDASSSEIETLLRTLTAKSFKGNVTRAILTSFNLPETDLVDNEFLQFACAVDSFIKNSNRIKAINSLRGFPTDFYGPGWNELYKDVESFNFLGEIKHTQISQVVNGYKVLINFDPNWENGVHDRVFTTLSCGSSLITNKNDYLKKVDGKIYTYDINNPNLKKLAERACNEYIDDTNSILLEHSWYERITTLVRNL